MGAGRSTPVVSSSLTTMVDTPEGKEAWLMHVYRLLTLLAYTAALCAIYCQKNYRYFMQIQRNITERQQISFLKKISSMYMDYC